MRSSQASDSVYGIIYRLGLELSNLTSLMNITISVPPGTTNHGEPDLLCIPPKWNDYLIFLGANYLAHAITVVTFPGNSWEQALVAAIAALLLPVSGIGRALNAMWERAIFFKDPVTRATRASALCMVVRAESRNSSGTHYGKWYEAAPKSEGYEGFIDERSLKVHGVYRLQEGWHFVTVPCRAPVSMPWEGADLRRDLSTPYNIAKPLIGLGQAVWAAITLYRARGDQIERYGYAAFGLTVGQYAYMSVLNVVGNILQPEYPAIFMLRTPLMDQAEQDGCFFSGELKAHLGEGQWSSTQLPSSTIISFVMVYTVCSLVPLALVGGLSGFRPQQSTVVQRLFTMWWLGASILLGPFLIFSLDTIKEWLVRAWTLRRQPYYLVGLVIVLTLLCVFCVTPFVGGIVEVMMIRDYGVCIRIG